MKGEQQCHLELYCSIPHPSRSTTSIRLELRGTKDYFSDMNSDLVLIGYWEKSTASVVPRVRLWLSSEITLYHTNKCGKIKSILTLEIFKQLQLYFMLMLFVMLLFPLFNYLLLIFACVINNLEVQYNIML